ncbi:hypothetical protein Plhal304r1_c086g0169151 [Plasmopara halstedii]
MFKEQYSRLRFVKYCRSSYYLSSTAGNSSHSGGLQAVYYDGGWIYATEAV